MPLGEYYVCYLPNAAKTNKCYSGRRLLALAMYFGEDLAVYKAWITPERNGGGWSGSW